MNFESAVAKCKWTAEQQVEVLLKYINQQDNEEAFNDYLDDEALSGKDFQLVYVGFITKAMRELPELDISLATECFEEEDKDLSYFYTMSSAIVEPDGLGESYYEFTETPEWIDFIHAHFGDDWCKMAKLIQEHGY